MSIDFQKHTLDNGLTVLAETSDQAHTASVGFFVQTGTRDEDHARMGVTHFLEHMIFKGTDRRSADDVNREFDEIGANYNAYTSHEQTVFFARILPEYLPRAVDVFTDVLRPALRADDFEMEKNVILEEIGMYEDRPQWRLQDTLLEEHFADHPLGYRVLGTGESIRGLEAGQMRDYFQNRYSPDNIVVVAAGRVDFDRLVHDVAHKAGDWQPTGARREHGRPRPRSHEKTLNDKNLTRHYVAMLAPGPSAQDERRYAARVLADVVGDTDGSRLYWELVDPGLADEADFSFIPYDRAGGYMGYASCSPGQADRVEAMLQKVIDHVGPDLSTDEVDRAKNKLATQATLQGENPVGRMRDIGHQWLDLDQYTPLEEEIRRIEAVNVEDLQDLLHEYPFQPRTLVRLTPAETA